MKVLGFIILSLISSQLLVAQCEDELRFEYEDHHIQGSTKEIFVLFTTGYSLLKFDSATVKNLRELASFHKKYPNYLLEIQCHTDTRGNETANQIISQKRAEAIIDYLINKYNVDITSFQPIGYGETKPKVSDEIIEQAVCNRTKEDLHQLNRRTTVLLVSKEK